MSDAIQDDFRPVFIVGFPRSGTTLLATMLSRHPNLAATPETHFMDLVTPTVITPEDCKKDAMLRRYAESPRTGDLDIDDDTLPTLIRNDYASFFEALLNHLAQRAGKPRIIEKTPAHLPHVPRLMEWYPEARVICIVRDGRDAVRSMMAQPWGHNDLRRHCRRWRRYAAMTRVYQDRFTDRFRVVHYEQLLSDPESTIRSIDKFIGEDFDKAQLDWETAPDASTIPDWEKEWKEKAAAPPDVKRAGAWREDASPNDRWLMNAAMGPWLEHFGYEDTSLDACPLHLRAWHCIADKAYDIALSDSVRPIAKRILAPFRPRVSTSG